MHSIMIEVVATNSNFKPENEIWVNMKREMIQRKWKAAEDLGVANIVENALFGGGEAKVPLHASTSVAPLPEAQVRVLSTRGKE